jgi:hypothetical protein
MKMNKYTIAQLHEQLRNRGIGFKGVTLKQDLIELLETSIKVDKKEMEHILKTHYSSDAETMTRSIINSMFTSSENKSNQIKKIDQNKSGIIYPQGSNYTFDKKKEFDQFLQDENFAMTLSFIKHLIMSQTYNQRFDLLATTILKDSLCKTDVVIVGEPVDNENIRFTTEITLENLVPRFIMSINLLINMNSRFRETLSQCLRQKTRFIYLNIMLIINKTYVKTDIVDDTTHSTVFILDTKLKKLIYLEPSVSGAEDHWILFEKMIVNGVTQVIQEATQMKLQADTMQEETCPRINIQGQSDLCAYFSLYMVFLYILNGSRKTIFHHFNSVSQKERYKELSEFIFFIFNFVKQNKIILWPLSNYDQVFERDAEFIRNNI